MGERGRGRRLDASTATNVVTIALQALCLLLLVAFWLIVRRSCKASLQTTLCGSIVGCSCNFSVVSKTRWTLRSVNWAVTKPQAST